MAQAPLRNPRPPFPEVIDSTIMSTFRSCPRKAFLEYLLHYKTATPSVHLHAGGAFAHGLEKAREAFFTKGLSSTESIATGLKALIEFYGDFPCPPESAKSRERMAGALEYYFSAYPLETEKAPPFTLPSGRKAIEFSFNHPIDITHPVTGNPILYCGRMDQIVDFCGSPFGEDDKTTSALGASWAKQWDLRAQFTGYCWGAREAAGIELAGFLVRGISILKTKYDTLEPITYRAGWMIDLWYEQTRRSVLKMIDCWNEGYWDYDLGDACTAYGGCPFKSVCLSADPNPWLATGFQRRVWDPIERTEIILEHV
jgi:hypothetical protein